MSNHASLSLTPEQMHDILSSPVYTTPRPFTLTPPLMAPCGNCFGTGTVFHGRSLKVGNSRKCPVCKGACKLPAIEAISSYSKDPK